jgi:hypothetical protein
MLEIVMQIYSKAAAVMTAEELATAIAVATGRQFKRAGRQFLGPCVAHDDHNPSMIIFDGRASVQVRCLAGCTSHAIITELKALGLWDRNKSGSAARDPAQRPPPPAREQTEGRAKARWLWRQRRPIEATLAETYVREHRGITCPLPDTLGFLPANGRHPATIIAAVGMAMEIESDLNALDELQAAAVQTGLVNALGQGAVQVIMAGAFVAGCAGDDADGDDDADHHAHQDGAHDDDTDQDAVTELDQVGYLDCRKTTERRAIDLAAADVEHWFAGQEFGTGQLIRLRE